MNSKLQTKTLLMIACPLRLFFFSRGAGNHQPEAVHRCERKSGTAEEEGTAEGSTIFVCMRNAVRAGCVSSDS